MEIVIKGKNMDVPQKAKEYIEKKADKFDRLLRNISTAKVELSEEKTSGFGRISPAITGSVSKLAVSISALVKSGSKWVFLSVSSSYLVKLNIILSPPG